MQRRDSECIGRMMLKMEQPGRRQRGKPKRRFIDMVREDMQIVFEADQREKWRRMICCGDSCKYLCNAKRGRRLLSYKAGFSN